MLLNSLAENQVNWNVFLLLLSGTEMNSWTLSQSFSQCLILTFINLFVKEEITDVFSPCAQLTNLIERNIRGWLYKTQNFPGTKNRKLVHLPFIKVHGGHFLTNNMIKNGRCQFNFEELPNNLKIPEKTLENIKIIPAKFLFISSYFVLWHQLKFRIS